MRSPVKIDVDKSTGALYIKIDGATPKFSKELPGDPELIVSFNSEGSIVGAILLSASETSNESWLENPTREKIPQELREALDEWFALQDGIQ